MINVEIFFLLYNNMPLADQMTAADADTIGTHIKRRNKARNRFENINFLNLDFKYSLVFTHNT